MTDGCKTKPTSSQIGWQARECRHEDIADEVRIQSIRNRRLLSEPPCDYTHSPSKQAGTTQELTMLKWIGGILGSLIVGVSIWFLTRPGTFGTSAVIGGSIQREGKPVSGVMVMLDDKTPARTDSTGYFIFSKVSKGSHFVRVSANEHQHLYHEFFVNEGDPKIELGSMELSVDKEPSCEPKFANSGTVLGAGEILLLSGEQSAQDADVYINNSERCEGKMLRSDGKVLLLLAKVPAGTYQIVIKKPGYGAFSRAVIVKAGERTEVDFGLEPQ